MQRFNHLRSCSRNIDKSILLPFERVQTSLTLYSLTRNIAQILCNEQLGYTS